MTVVGCAILECLSFYYEEVCQCMQSQSKRRAKRKDESYELPGHPPECDCPLCEHELLSSKSPKPSKREVKKARRSRINSRGYTKGGS
jgi:hypothetical protein